MRKATFTIFSSFVGLILFSLLIIWLLNAKPVLLEWDYDRASACSSPLVILNPLRNREVEQAADTFLDKIRNDHYEVIDDAVSDIARRDHFKESESKFKIKSWTAGDRLEEENKVSFVYWITREYDDGCGAEGSGIEVEKKDGVWKVTGYYPIY